MSTPPSPVRPGRSLLCVGAALALLASLWAATALGADAATPAAGAKDTKSKSKGKSRPKKPKGTAATLSQMLTEKSSLVQDCAGKFALDKGSSRVDISTKVTINNRGQVISIMTNVNLDKGDGSGAVKDCIEGLVRSIKFPASDAPLITIERNWTISN